MDIKEKKKILREKIWKLLEEKGVARFPLPLKDRIPNFEGSDKAAELMTNLPEWKRAKIIFIGWEKVAAMVIRRSIPSSKNLVKFWW